MAIIPDKNAIEAAGLEYIEPTEIVADTGPKALNLLAQAVVDLMAKGSGSGVREVSGTVALDATGPRILEFYTVGAATIGGVQFPEDTAVVFRRTADGAWTHLTVDWDGGVTTVSPTAPTFSDQSGTALDTYTIPTTAGVDYRVEGVIKAAGTYPASGAVTIQATPASEGVTLVGTVSWTHTFSAGTVENWTTQSLSAAFIEADGTNATGSIYNNPDHSGGPEVYAGYTDETGHFWQGTSSGIVIRNGMLVASGNGTAYAKHGVTGDYSLRAKVQIAESGNAHIAGRKAESATPGRPVVGDAPSSGHSIILTPTEISFGYSPDLVINFNASGSLGDRAPHGLSAGQWATLRFDMLGTIGTLWVDGTRMFEVDFAGTSAQLGSGDYITLYNGTFDDVELWTI